MNRFKFLLLIFLCTICLFTGCKTKEKDSNHIQSIRNKENIETTEKVFSFRKAKDIVSSMGVGWNLGNTLDSCDFEKKTQEDIDLRKTDYQLMAVYENANWSAWDASKVSNFDNNGIASITWKIDQLNSDLSGACGLFSFQIIDNTGEDIGNKVIKFSVTKAIFTTKEGNVIELSDIFSTYEMTLNNGVTDYIKADLMIKDQLKTARDLVDGTLEIVVKIIKFPILQNHKNVQTAVEYYETLWGNPVTTKEMIETVAQAGFKSIRIPVTYYDHIDSNGIIDPSWLARVKEIVEYALSSDLICIINVHHDTGEGAWIKADLETIDMQKKNLNALWQQIAVCFNGYGDNLLFEGMNEILNSNNEWNDVDVDSYQAVNQLNQQFVVTVRNTGGNNVNRNLIVNTYVASNLEEALNNFTIPSDSTKDHIIGGVHYYSEISSEPDNMNGTFERLKVKFLDQGIPVIIGEFATYSNISEEDSVEYITQFMNKAKESNICVLWWDRGGDNADSSNPNQTKTLFDRRNLTWYSDKILSAVLLSD